MASARCPPQVLPLESPTDSTFYYAEGVKSQWALEKVHIPEDWINSTKPMYIGKRCLHTLGALLRINDMLLPLTMAAQRMRFDCFMSHEPDFLFASYGTVDLGTEFEMRVAMSSFYNFLHLQSILFFNRDPSVRVPHSRDFSPEYMADLLSDILEDLPRFTLRREVGSGFHGLRRVLFGLTVGKGRDNNLSQLPQVSVNLGRVQVAAGYTAVSGTHRAVMLGITHYGSTDEPAVNELTRLIFPSLDSMLRTWQMRQRRRGQPVEPLPPWLVLFSLIITPRAITFVAHSPATDPHSGATLCNSQIVDKIPYHPDIWYGDQGHSGALPSEAWTGPVNASDAWIRDRLRLFVAMQTILKSGRRVAGVWDGLWAEGYFGVKTVVTKHHWKWDRPAPRPSVGGPAPSHNQSGPNPHQDADLDEIIVEVPKDPEVERARAERLAKRVQTWRERMQL